MDGEIRVQIHAEVPDCCPVSRISSNDDETVSMISWSLPDEDENIVEEFTVSGRQFPDAENAETDGSGVETVFEGKNQTRFRFERSHGNCICNRIEEAGYPIETIRVEHRGLSISFFVSSLEDLNELVTDLRDSFDGIRLQSLQQTDDLEEDVPIWIDRSKLTPRQEEVLRTAFEMGYFDYPKRANAGDVAVELNIGLSTFSEHLSAAQSKLLEDVF